ncbi:MAG: Ferric-anguibactin receptor FatA [Burkholderia lata]|uniref:Ferric-anguibactin receptor FatA n=1 Tax=Burkholderia lata (strain ATCC 17760 / DSM 23089 / LMG 22485 / NCIMB 9086 / R18194 / 383) TaxID=482957 RepID=A0A833UVR7_BURL3|nr:TonB-dependent receptor [Burkholderia lata]KAF1032052.1 MAG: Ferric-anguibactin receptor FatA [Burkholderia lata]
MAFRRFSPSAASRPANRPARRRAASRAFEPALAAALALAMPIGAQAQPDDPPSRVDTDERRAYAIPAGALDVVLNRYAVAAGVELASDAALTQHLASDGLNARVGVAEGFARLLAPHGLEAVRTGGGYLVRRRASAVPAAAGAGAMLPTIVVNARAEALPEAYTGGQVARGGRLGMLGNADFMDAPFNITSYTSALIENQQAGTVADVLENDPSVRFTTSTGHIVENYTIRGFNVIADDLAFNGMYGLAPYGHSPTEFIERIEVLKGPNALLNGISPSGGVGGAINLVPKRAGDTPLARLTTDYISDGQFGVHADLGRRFGDRNQVGIRVNGAYRDGRTTMDGQNKKREFASLAFDVKGERARFSLDAYTDTERFDNGSPWMASFASQVVSPPSPGTNLLRGAWGKLDNQAVVARGELDLTDRITAYAGIGGLSYRYAGFINGTRAGAIQPNGNYRAVTYNQNGYTDTTSIEAGARARFRTGPVSHQVSLGVTSLQIEAGTINRTSATFASNIYAPIDPPLAPSPGSAPKTSESALTSVALADTLSFARDRVQLTVGLRSQRVHAKTYAAATGLKTADYNETALTPAFALVVRPFGPDVSLYANYVEGLTQGDTVSDVTAKNYGQMFAPYKSKQVEVGAKWETDTFANTLSLFQITKPSMLKDPATNLYSADGEQRNRGVEWNVFGQVVPRLRVLGGVAYTQALLTHTAGGAYDGNTAYGVPKWTANLGLEWDAPWVRGLTLSARAVATSAQCVNSTNTQRIPGWTRVDLGARYATQVAGKAVVLRGAVENVANRTFWAGTFNDGYVTQNAPRTFKVSATIDF